MVCHGDGLRLNIESTRPFRTKLLIGMSRRLRGDTLHEEGRGKMIRFPLLERWNNSGMGMDMDMDMDIALTLIDPAILSCSVY